MSTKITCTPESIHEDFKKAIGSCVTSFFLCRIIEKKEEGNTINQRLLTLSLKELFVLTLEGHVRRHVPFTNIEALQRQAKPNGDEIVIRCKGERDIIFSQPQNPLNLENQDIQGIVKMILTLAPHVTATEKKTENESSSSFQPPAPLEIPSSPRSFRNGPNVTPEPLHDTLRQALGSSATNVVLCRVVEKQAPYGMKHNRLLVLTYSDIYVLSCSGGMKRHVPLDALERVIVDLRHKRSDRIEVVIRPMVEHDIIFTQPPNPLNLGNQDIQGIVNMIVALAPRITPMVLEKSGPTSNLEIEKRVERTKDYKTPTKRYQDLLERKSTTSAPGSFGSPTRSDSGGFPMSPTQLTSVDSAIMSPTLRSPAAPIPRFCPQTRLPNIVPTGELSRYGDPSLLYCRFVHSVHNHTGARVDSVLLVTLPFVFLFDMNSNMIRFVKINVIEKYLVTEAVKSNNANTGLSPTNSTSSFSDAPPAGQLRFRGEPELTILFVMEDPRNAGNPCDPPVYLSEVLSRVFAVQRNTVLPIHRLPQEAIPKVKVEITQQQQQPAAIFPKDTAGDGAAAATTLISPSHNNTNAEDSPLMVRETSTTLSNDSFASPSDKHATTKPRAASQRRRSVRAARFSMLDNLPRSSPSTPDVGGEIGDGEMSTQASMSEIDPPPPSTRTPIVIPLPSALPKPGPESPKRVKRATIVDPKSLTNNSTSQPAPQEQPTPAANITKTPPITPPSPMFEVVSVKPIDQEILRSTPISGGEGVGTILTLTPPSPKKRNPHRNVPMMELPLSRAIDTTTTVPSQKTDQPLPNPAPATVLQPESYEEPEENDEPEEEGEQNNDDDSNEDEQHGRDVEEDDDWNDDDENSPSSPSATERLNWPQSLRLLGIRTPNDLCFATWNNIVTALDNNEAEAMRFIALHGFWMGKDGKKDLLRRVTKRCPMLTRNPWPNAPIPKIWCTSKESLRLLTQMTARVKSS